MTSYREALEELCNRDGFLTPEQVVGEAVDPGHPLHAFFEWDDSEAATRYRLAQAGQLIRSVKITVAVANEETRRVRAFTSVPREDKTVYVPTDTALKEDRDFVMGQALRDLAALRNKYRGLVDFDAVLAAFTEESKAA